MWQELLGQGKSQQGPKLCQKWQQQTLETTCTSSYDKKVIYKILNQSDPMKDVRGVAGTRSDGGNERWRNGCTHGWTRVISLVPSADVG